MILVSKNIYMCVYSCGFLKDRQSAVKRQFGREHRICLTLLAYLLWRQQQQRAEWRLDTACAPAHCA